LLSFSKNDYRNILNKNREEIVDRELGSGTYFEQHLKNLINQAQLEAFQAERDKLPQFLVASYEQLLQSLDKALRIIKNNVK
jgi:hypothetical protein